MSQSPTDRLRSTAAIRPSVMLIATELPDASPHEVQVQLRELHELVENLPYTIATSHTVRVRQINPKFLLGSGKVEELSTQAKAEGISTLIFDEQLSPSQQRNWEETTGLRVIDRQEVILEIFEARAQTREAVLQVQLARLEYMLPRLKRAWTHLERQRGGGGAGPQRGVGETQLEIDHRLVRDKIAALSAELDVVKTQRAQQRKSRQRLPLTSVAIVGYTNSGKSTLLNTLTGASVLAEDKLFATLDPTTRRLQLPSGQRILLTDTVGFIRKLPTTLIDAFKATLEETVQADFLIHLLDLSDSEVERQRATTLDVLAEIGASGKETLTVYNKVDRAGLSRPPQSPSASYISALSGEGIPQLLERIQSIIAADSQPLNLLIPHSRYDIVNMLHEAGAVSSQKHEADGIYITGLANPRIAAYTSAFARPAAKARKG
jgi:GTPase